MIVYRLAHKKFADAIDGTGAKLYGGRWNSPGIATLYTSESVSLAVLELLVHIPLRPAPAHFCLAHLHIPDNSAPRIIKASSLKKNWSADLAYTRFIGDSFLAEKKSLLLQVPSVVVTTENNFLVNTAHPEFRYVKLKQLNDFNFDERLLLTHA